MRTAQGDGASRLFCGFEAEEAARLAGEDGNAGADGAAVGVVVVEDDACGSPSLEVGGVFGGEGDVCKGDVGVGEVGVGEEVLAVDGGDLGLREEVGIGFLWVEVEGKFEEVGDAVVIGVGGIVGGVAVVESVEAFPACGHAVVVGVDWVGGVRFAVGVVDVEVEGVAEAEESLPGFEEVFDAIAVGVAIAVPEAGVVGVVVERVEAGPVFTELRDVVVVGVAGELAGGAWVGASGVEGDFGVVGEAVAIGVDEVLAVEVEGDLAGDAGGFVGIGVGNVGFEEVRSVGEGAPEAVFDAAGGIASVEDVGEDAAGAGEVNHFVAVPVEFDVGGGEVGGDVEACGKEGHADDGTFFVVDGDGGAIADDVEGAGGGGLVDDGAWVAPVGFGGGDGDGVSALGEAGEAVFPEAAVVLVHGLGRAAVDGDVHGIGGVVGIGDSEDGVAWDGGVVGGVFDGEGWTRAVEVDDFVEGLVEGWEGWGTLDEAASLNEMEAVGNVGDVGSEAPVAWGELGGGHVAGGDDVVSAEGVDVGIRVEVAALSPADDDAIDGGAGWGVEVDVDIDGVGGDAGDLAGFGWGVDASGDDPGDGGDLVAALEEADGFAVGFGDEWGVVDPALATGDAWEVAGDGDGDLAGVDGDVVGVVAGVVFEDGAVGEGGL